MGVEKNTAIKPTDSVTKENAAEQTSRTTDKTVNIKNNKKQGTDGTTEKRAKTKKEEPDQLPIVDITEDEKASESTKQPEKHQAEDTKQNEEKQPEGTRQTEEKQQEDTRQDEAQQPAGDTQKENEKTSATIELPFVPAEGTE